MPSPTGRKVASAGGRSTVLRSFANHASAPGPAIATPVAPATGRLSSSAIRQRGSFQRVPSYSSRTGAESAVRAWRGGGSEIGRGHLDRIEPHRQRDRLAALEPRQRADDPAGGKVLREPLAGLAGHDLDGEAAAHELRLDVTLVDLAGERRELEVERGLVGLHRRRDLGAEEPRLQPLEAADRAEALALPRGGVDRRRPVGLDAEGRRLDRVLLAAGGEDDRNARDPLEAALEQRPRLLLRQAADVDAGDVDALGDPRRRAREGKADQRRHDGEKRQGNQDPARDEAHRAVGYPGANRCRVYPHEPVSVATASAAMCPVW